ncbi:MAG TPA: uracil-DNA glycosylase [Anaerolineales bacterium]|nr:uracil-DNA glycosylase [Anaerolineales bacterium]
MSTNINDMESLEENIITCRKCPRLVAWREEVTRVKRKSFMDWKYWGKPVPGFGDHRARVLVVGLAPGAHGSNRTGRMFTGDGSGDFLFPALYNAGFSSQPDSISLNDDLVLKDLYLTAICRCVPPGNRPDKLEIQNCKEYLVKEIKLINPKVLVALGKIAFDGLKETFPGIKSNSTFIHGAVYQINDRQTLVCSYHPSRQNTQTGRLTKEMFAQVWKKVSLLVYDKDD